MGEFHFQAPGASKFLLSVNIAASAATEGLGVFAFASTGGVHAFLDAVGFGSTWSAPKHFHLIVGIDAITNADALLAIADRIRESRGALSAEVFLHGQPGSTFHPKFVVFSSRGTSRFLTGSGNLTTRGLGEASAAAFPPGNWEAFSVLDFDGEAAAQHYRDTMEWLQAERSLGRLRSIEDEEVKARAMANGLLRFTPPSEAAPSGTPSLTRSRGMPAAPTGGTWNRPGGWTAPRRPGAAPAVGAPPAVGHESQAPLDSDALSGGDLLIKELPKNRPGQADVGKQILEEFFGYTGDGRTILLQYVAVDNSVGTTEPIHLFENDSRNFRLELRAVADFPYDIGQQDERIVVVVARLDTRSYRYTVVPVTSPEYPTLSGVLGPTMSGGRRLMRSARFPLASLPVVWPGAPANLRPVLANTPTP